MKNSGYLKKISILFFIGFLAGILCAVFWSQSYTSAYQEFFKEITKRLEDGGIQYGLLYGKAAKKIMAEYFSILLFCLSILGLPYMIGFTVYKGFWGGLLLGSLYQVYHLKGIFYGLLYGFPHMLIYIPVLVITMYKGYQLCITGQKKKGLKEQMVPLGLLLFLLLAGAALETFLNSWIMENMIFLVS